MMKLRIDTNLKRFMFNVVILIAIIFLSRVLFQFPIEYLKIQLFRQTVANRLFSKIDALQVLLLISVFFGFYYRNRISAIPFKGQSLAKSALFVLAGELTIAAYYVLRGATNYYDITSGINLWLIQAGIFLSLLAAFLLFAIAVFTFDYLVRFAKAFRKELIVSAIAGVILYNLLILFQNQWLFFSKGVANVLQTIFSHFYAVSYYFAKNGPILTVNNFSVAIGPPCSGIDSMFLFTAFFAGLFALDHKRIKKAVFFSSFVIGLAGVYAVNILRLFLLILAGINISPKFAVGLFHTNAGWLLFVIYFLGYYMIIRKFIYKDKLPKAAK